MSWELQIRNKKKEWIKIQTLRIELDRTKKQYRELGSRIKSLAQIIPKELDKFNKSMEGL